MKKTRLYGVLALAMAATLALSACGETQTAAPADTVPADAQSEVAAGSADATMPAASGDASGDASGNATYVWNEAATASVAYNVSASGDFAFGNVVYGDGYVATTATADDTVNSTSASTNIVAVDVIQDGKTVETIKAENGGVLTLIANTGRGFKQVDIIDAINDAETYKSRDVVFYETEAADTYTEFAKFGNMAGNDSEYTYRSALVYNDGEMVATQSIPQLLDAGAIDGTTVTGQLKLGKFFNGIIAKSSDVTLDAMTVSASGDGANDFKGEAAVVLADGTSNVTIKDTYIYTQGVIRTAAAVQGEAVLNIKDSVIYTEETADTNAQYDALVVPMMKRTPFALGLEGVVRATNVLGAGQGIYRDSIIVSSGWGVLSTDSGKGYDQVGTYALDVANVVAGTGSVEVAEAGKDYYATKEVNGVTYGYIPGGSGYVAYADSGVYDKFDNVDFYSDDYVQIMASSTSSAFYTNSKLHAGRIAVMTQQNAGGTISIKDSEVYAEDTVFQIKSGAANAGYTNVVLDNAKVTLGKDNKWGGTLVELVESDDAGNPGNVTFTVNDEGDSAQPGAADLSDSTALIANGEYTGNIWNNIYANTELLDVTIDNATVNGTISSSYGYHVADNGSRIENGTVLYACTEGDYRTSSTETGDYRKIGAQYNVANQQVNNPINVKLTNGSTWNVVLANGSNGEADACYVQNLVVEDGCTIDAKSPVTIYVYGDQDIKGTVGANVTIEAAEVDFSNAVDDGIANKTQFYESDGVPVQFYIEKDGEASKNAAVIDSKSFTDYIEFSVDVDCEVSTDIGTITEGSENGYQYTLTNAKGNKDTVTVTVKVK